MGKLLLHKFKPVANLKPHNENNKVRSTEKWSNSVPVLSLQQKGFCLSSCVIKCFQVPACVARLQSWEFNCFAMASS